MADDASEDGMWEEVLSSIDNLLIDIEIQDDNPDLSFHEATLLLNRLEMALTVLRSLLDMDLDFDAVDGDTNQVIGQLCSLLTEIYQYCNEKVIHLRRRTVSLPDFGSRGRNHSGNPGRHPLSSKRNYWKIYEVVVSKCDNARGRQAAQSLPA